MIKTIKQLLALAVIGAVIAQLFSGGGLFYYLVGLVLFYLLIRFKRARGTNQYINKWRV